MSEGNPILAEKGVPTEVSAQAGRFVGLKHDGFIVFKGIRYGQSPTGARRFAPPVPEPAAENPFEAFAPGPISIQDIDPLPLVVPGAEWNYYSLGAVASEDCLNLNVWSPNLSGRVPVIVWIHGGAFLCGSGSGLWAEGTRLAREHGVVVVTLNYRLGYLGGLFLGDYDASRGNLALQDQLLALQWVKDNIAAFGGDPDRVTVGGQSAGAMSVAALLVAPAGRGLFRRAIIDSGHLDSIIDIDSARETTQYILGHLGVDMDGDVLGQLRGVTTFRITSLQRELGISRRAFPLVGDGVTLPSDPFAVLETRSDVDILVGTTSEEDRLFAVTGWASSPKALSETLTRYLPEEGARAEAEALYAPILHERAGDRIAIAHLIATDHGWAEPARRLVSKHAGAGGRSYLYEFSWVSSALEGRVGAGHLVDLPFFFDNLGAPGAIELLGEAMRDPSAAQLAHDLAASIAAFAATGNPSGPLGEWPPFSPANRATKVLGDTSRTVVDRLADRLDFWTRQHGRSVPALSTLGA